MKTKHRILSVLTILALVASLCAVMVAPVAASVPVTAAPYEGAVGTVVTLRMTGWSYGDLITSVTFDGVAVTTAPALPESVPDTHILYLTFRVPASTIDAKTIRVSDGVRHETVTFTVKPRVDISPLRGAQGSAATATVTGFAAGVAIDVFAGANRVGGGVTTDARGSATVPLTMAHEGNITATDGAGNPSVIHPDRFDFTPSITLDPITGLGGTTVTIEGSDFPVHPAYIPANNIWFAGEVVVTPRITLTDRDDDGDRDDFRQTITIAVGTTAGPRVVRVEDNIGGIPGTATATFDVIGPAAPTITLDPVEGFPGTEVRVTGINFPALDRVSIHWGRAAGEPMLVPEMTTDSLGRFAATITVPLAPSGREHIWAGIVGGDPVGDDDAEFQILPGEPVTGVRDGLDAVWADLAESVWLFQAGNWYQRHTNDDIHALIPAGQRLAVLERGEAYWIYLTEAITDVHFGGMERTLAAGWHNVGWLD